MKRKAYFFSFLALAVALMGGCSSKPAAEDAAKVAPKPDKIQGKAQLLDEHSASDSALSAGGSSVYIWVGARRFRLFLRTRPEVEQGREYAVEGFWAQRVIDEIGDPAQGANGYPLADSCRRVVSMAWKGMAFDALDAQTELLRATVQRHPARPLFLVTKFQPASPDADASKKDAKKDQEIHEITVPAEKQRALLLETPPVLTAPLWQTAGGSAKCKVYIDPEGKVSELLSGIALCEAVDWSQYRYKPTVSGGRPVHVNSEVEVKFEPRK